MNNQKGVILVIFIFSISLLLLYFRDNEQKKFLKEVNGVYILNQNKKIVFSGSSVFITNGELDKVSSKKVASNVNQPPKTVRVPFYNEDYIVVESPRGEGSYDYVIFDGDGKLITNSLLASSQEFITDFKIKEHDSIPSAALINLRDDGTIILKITEQNNSYSIKFDLTTGKYLGKI